ncbi:MAG TPA: hypothetical protein DEP84_36215, partial [Chloroflexi bacterium]|nr:hypothetical protein [Chloroflexota bacterium]
MDLANIGTPELVIIVVVAFLLVGPRQAVEVAREIGKFLNQIRTVSGDLYKQLDLELARQESSRRRSSAPASRENGGSFELPEAYRRFREEFPEEGLPDDAAGPPAGPNGQSGQESPNAVTSSVAPTAGPPAQG